MKIFVIVVAVLLILSLLLFWRRKRAMCKVRKMTPGQRIQKINHLAAEFGYYYIPSQNIFAARIDAWQRKFGYEAFYDKAAARFNMVYDCVPVYFDYDGKSWLIEFWKGQYGINIGSEIGVYNVNYIVPEEKRKTIHYHAVRDDEMLDMAFILFDEGKRCYTWEQRHWWLAAFQTGMFQQPSKLQLRLRIRFPNGDMATAFVEGLKQTGYPADCVQWNCTWVTINFSGQSGIKWNWWQRLCRAHSQWENKCCVALYCMTTKPFQKTVDKILFLYYQLPICVRKLLLVRRFGRRERKERKCWKR